VEGPNNAGLRLRIMRTASQADKDVPPVKVKGADHLCQRVEGRQKAVFEDFSAGGEMQVHPRMALATDT
jgi:hypothetical protein